MEQAAAQNFEPDDQSEEEKKSEEEPEAEAEQQEGELEVEGENGQGSPVFNRSLSQDSFNKADLEELPVNQVQHSNITDATKGGQTRDLFPEVKNKQGRIFLQLKNNFGE